LVTGSAGFIGQAVAAELASRGHTCQPFDKPDDVCDPNQVLAAVGNADAVINLAGVLGTAEIIGSESRAAEVNVMGALNVLDAAGLCGVPLVQIATGHEGQPNPYAITKRCASDLALARAQWTGQPVTVVRAYHVYGPGQKPPAPHGPSTVRKIVPSFACRALTGMPIEVWGSGRQVIDLVHVADVAAALVDAIGGPYGRVVEAGTGKPTTVLDAAKEIGGRIAGARLAAYLNFGDRQTLTASPYELPPTPVQIQRMPMRPGEPEDATVVASAPACPNPWPHRLDETIDWYRDYLDGRP
jgi:UDP-glucose 4-epimerase